MRQGLVAACLAAGVSTVCWGQDARTVAGFDEHAAATGSFIIETPQPFRYKGLTWRDVVVIDTLHPSLKAFAGSGLQIGAASGRLAAIVASRAVESSRIEAPAGARFDFHGAVFTAAWRRGLEVHVEGLRKGAVVYTSSFQATVDSSFRMDFDFKGIDGLRITTTGGEDAGICGGAKCQPGPEVVVDDFEFTLRAPPPSISEEPPPVPATTSAEASPVVAPAGETDSGETPTAEDSRPVAAVAEPASAAALPAEAPTESEPSLEEPSPSAVVEEEPAPAQLAAPEAPPRGGPGCTLDPYRGVLVGTFRSFENARLLRRRLAEEHGAAQIHRNDSGQRTLYRVVAGCAKNADLLDDLAQALRDANLGAIPVVASDRRFGRRLADDDE